MAITATEQTALSVTQANPVSLITGTTPAAQTDDAVIQVFIDGLTAPMAKGDEFLIKVYEKVRSGGAQRIVYEATLSDAQSEVFVTPHLTVVNGWDVTMTKISATNRTFDTSVRKIA
jgi:hypothetical protein